MLSFSSEVFIIGVNPYVPVPQDILDVLRLESQKKTGPIPVKGKLNGNEFIQTIVKYQGLYRLYLNGPMLKAAKIGVGDLAHVTVTCDLSSRTPEMPEVFANMLKEENVWEIYDALAPYRKKEILRYLKSMKTEESLLRNCKKIITHLLGQETDTLYALMRRTPKR